MDDAALILLIQGAQQAPRSKLAAEEAVGILYDRYGRLVYSIAIHIVGDAETAEEITQDVFVRACQAAGAYHPEAGKVSSWLAGITRHRAIDELRRRGARPEKDSLSLTPGPDMEPLELEATEEGPEDMVEHRLARRRIKELLAVLPDEQRQALDLAFYHGMTHSQMADFLGEPLGTVKSRLRLAMQRLRKVLTDQGAVDL